MNFQESFAAHMADQTAVVARVARRIYPLLIPQRALADDARHACLVYSRIGITRFQTLCGTDALVSSSLQVDTYARTYDEALAIAKVTRDALIDFAGELGGSGGIIVKTITLDSEVELQDPDPGLYRVSQTYTVWHLQD